MVLSNKLFTLSLVVGTILCPALSCNDILQQNPLSASGIYWIKRPAFLKPVPVYCEMVDNIGWTMVFKFSTYLYGEPLAQAKYIWFGSETNEFDFNQLNTLGTNQRYMNEIPPYWNIYSNTILQARVNVYVAGILQQFVQFNASGTDNVNWFSLDRVVDTSWDFNNIQPQYFSLQGDSAFFRSFSISTTIGTCITNGWLEAFSGDAEGNGRCSYETFARVIYSDTPDPQYYAPYPIAPKVADALAVMVVLDDTGLSNGACKKPFVSAHISIRYNTANWFLWMCCCEL